MIRVLWLLGLSAIVLSFPVDGLPGAGLALAGMGCIWIAYRRSRRGGAR